MNDLLNLMAARRSIRKYTGDPISEEALNSILRAGLLSPSGCNYRPWEFVAVRDKDMLTKLSYARTGSADMLKQADCAIVVLGDTDKTTVWCEDCSIAMAQMHLMAHSLGLGSCWIQMRLRTAQTGETSDCYLRQLLSYPDNLSALAILSLGIPAETRPAHDIPQLPDEKVHFEKY